MLTRRPTSIAFSATCLFAFLLTPSAHEAQPFGGTTSVDPDIITPADASALVSVSYAGQARRAMADGRREGGTSVDAYLFDAVFENGQTIEIQVNPEFGDVDTSLAVAQKYAFVIGQMPRALRTHTEIVWIQKGWGGNVFQACFRPACNQVLVHTDTGDSHIRRGKLEEVMVHETTHNALDTAHAYASGWLAAQDADGRFISNYASENSGREDLAESFLLWMAVRYRRDRLDESVVERIVERIPNRMAYFDSLSLDMYPIVATHTAVRQRTLGSIKSQQLGGIEAFQ